jgi:hypothetical protein
MTDTSQLPLATVVTVAAPASVRQPMCYPPDTDDINTSDDPYRKYNGFNYSVVNRPVLRHFG